MGPPSIAPLAPPARPRPPAGPWIGPPTGLGVERPGAAWAGLIEVDGRTAMYVEVGDQGAPGPRAAEAEADVVARAFTEAGELRVPIMAVVGSLAVGPLDDPRGCVPSPVLHPRPGRRQAPPPARTSPLDQPVLTAIEAASSLLSPSDGDSRSIRCPTAAVPAPPLGKRFAADSLPRGAPPGMDRTTGSPSPDERRLRAAR